MSGRSGLLTTSICALSGVTFAYAGARTIVATRMRMPRAELSTSYSKNMNTDNTAKLLYARESGS